MAPNLRVFLLYLQCSILKYNIIALDHSRCYPIISSSRVFLFCLYTKKCISFVITNIIIYYAYFGNIQIDGR